MKARLVISRALILFLFLHTVPAQGANTVRSTDIVDGQVMTVDLANNAVTSAKIQDGQVTNADLSAGAVTDAKISGVISVGKLPVGTTTGKVAAGDHNHDSLYQKKYGKVAVVAQSGGDYRDPVIAMSNIASWCGIPSSSNPCLLEIMPGIYDLGSSTFYMSQYVDVEGSGEDVTVIKSAATTGGWPLAGTVNGAANSEIRFLRVENSGSGPLAGGIVNSFGASSRLTHVTVSAVSESAQLCFGVSNSYSDQPMFNVTATVSGGAGAGAMAIGIWNSYSSPTMADVTIYVSGASYDNYAVLNQHSSPVMNNIVAAASGGLSPRGVFNELFSSPDMNNIRATAAGGQNNYGVYNTASSAATLMNVTAVASGATDTSTGIRVESSSVIMTNTIAMASAGVIHNYGIQNDASSTLTLTNVTATASGGASSNYGIYNNNSALTLSNVIAVARNGVANSGVFNSSSLSDILIDRCTIEGATSAAFNPGASAMRIGASKMVGPVNGGGTFTCVASYDENYVPLDGACQ